MLLDTPGPTPKQRLVRTGPRQLPTDHDHRNGCHENGADDRPQGNKRGSRGGLPHGHRSAREHETSRVQNRCGAVCISPDLPSSPQYGVRPHAHHADGVGVHREDSPCGHCASQLYDHNLGHARGCENQNAVGDSQTWFVPFTMWLTFARTRATLVEKTIPISASRSIKFQTTGGVLTAKAQSTERARVPVQREMERRRSTVSK